MTRNKTAEAEYIRKLEMIAGDALAELAEALEAGPAITTFHLERARRFYDHLNDLWEKSEEERAAAEPEAKEEAPAPLCAVCGDEGRIFTCVMDAAVGGRPCPHCGGPR